MKSLFDGEFNSDWLFSELIDNSLDNKATPCKRPPEILITGDTRGKILQLVNNLLCREELLDLLIIVAKGYIEAKEDRCWDDSVVQTLRRIGAIYE